MFGHNICTVCTNNTVLYLINFQMPDVIYAYCIMYHCVTWLTVYLIQVSSVTCYVSYIMLLVDSGKQLLAVLYISQ